MSLYCFKKNSIRNFPDETRVTSILNIEKEDCLTKCSKTEDCIGLNYLSNKGIANTDSVCDIYRNNSDNIKNKSIATNLLKVSKNKINTFCLHSKTFNNSGLTLTKFTNLVNEMNYPEKITYEKRKMIKKKN